MALSLTFSDNHVEDLNGNPHVGAKLYVCAAGTTTLSSIFSNEALSTPASNPLTSDSAGNFDRFYIAAGTYKLRAEQSNSTAIGTGTLIREEDNIDTGLSAGSGALPIASGGTGGTTAAAARSNLGAAASSDVTALSTQVTNLSTLVQSVIAAPQGRLTMTSATPVTSADVTAGTSVYYTPYIGNICPVWSGSAFESETFSELTLALNSNHLASTLYDAYVINDDETIRLVSGPAWNTSAAGSGARGSGAGTAEIERVNGLWVNKNAMTARYGATTVSVAAREGTFVGTMFMDGTNGQLTCHVGFGQSRKWGVWNAYNRQPISLSAGDSTASWTYATNTIRAANGAAANSFTFLAGLPEELLEAHYRIRASMSTNTTGQIGIGVNSTSAYSGVLGIMVSGGSAGIDQDMTAVYRATPAIGVHTITALERGISSTTTFNAGSTQMLLSGVWRG
jgi:hypothetical protein